MEPGSWEGATSETALDSVDQGLRPHAEGFRAGGPRPSSQDGNLEKSNTWASQKNNHPPRGTGLIQQSLNLFTFSFLSDVTENV